MFYFYIKIKPIFFNNILVDDIITFIFHYNLLSSREILYTRPKKSVILPIVISWDAIYKVFNSLKITGHFESAIGVQTNYNLKILY